MAEEPKTPPASEPQAEQRRTPTQEETVEELTKVKLRAEIVNLTKPFHQRIEFWQFISTFPIAILTYFVLWFNGAFDAKTKYLEMQRSGLVKDIEKFKRDTIGYSRTRDSLVAELAGYKQALITSDTLLKHIVFVAKSMDEPINKMGSNDSNSLFRQRRNLAMLSAAIYGLDSLYRSTETKK